MHLPHGAAVAAAANSKKVAIALDNLHIANYGTKDEVLDAGLDLSVYSKPLSPVLAVARPQECRVHRVAVHDGRVLRVLGFGTTSHKGGTTYERIAWRAEQIKSGMWDDVPMVVCLFGPEETVSTINAWHWFDNECGHRVNVVIDTTPELDIFRQFMLQWKNELQTA